MSLASLIENPLKRDSDGVWVSPDARPFAYTDGRPSEVYLEQVFSGAKDLSTRSAELASRIKDWPSEYHLSPARAQLLDGFNYDRSHRVLEVGCGCGAITRFLGETFDSVVAVEGSHARARLARMRTRDLDHVTVVNSPFQEIRFKQKFNMIFCIGVFEYATMFVEGEDPHAEILRYFDDLLEPGGVLVLAIENQLGLKYFGSSAEDHTGVLFDGIEGYPRRSKGARTFGREELRRRLAPRFPSIDFYYPWPDYKVPSCLISEDLIDRVNVAELVASFRSRDYGNRWRQPLFSESLAWRTIAANGLVPTLAHSFLVLASRSERATTRLQSLGVLYSSWQRRPEFSTRTVFEQGPDGTVRAVKQRTTGTPRHREGRLQHQECVDNWIDGCSLQSEMERRARAMELDFASIIEPSRPWFDDLLRSGSGDHETTVPGERIDSIWRNCFIIDGECRYIDREWSWSEPLPLWLVVARGLYYFAQSLVDAPGLSPILLKMNVGQLISSAAHEYVVEISKAQLQELARFEAAFLDQVTGNPGSRLGDVRGFLRRRLGQPASRRATDALRRRVRQIEGTVRRRLRR